MSTINLKPENLVLVAVAIGAAWYMTQRKAIAARPTARTSSTTQDFFVTPSGAPTASDRRDAAVINSVGSLLSGLLGRTSQQVRTLSDADRAAMRSGDAYYSTPAEDYKAANPAPGVDWSAVYGDGT